MRNGRSCRAWIGPHLHFVHVHQWTKVHQLTWIHKIVLWVLWCKSLFCNYNPQWRFVNTFDLHHAKEGQSLFLGWNPEHSAAYVFPSTAACQTFSFGLFSVTCSIERCWRPPHDSIKRQIKSTTKKRGFPDRHTQNYKAWHQVQVGGLERLKNAFGCLSAARSTTFREGYRCLSWFSWYHSYKCTPQRKLGWHNLCMLNCAAGLVKVMTKKIQKVRVVRVCRPS